eukprot:839751_1
MSFLGFSLEEAVTFLEQKDAQEAKFNEDDKRKEEEKRKEVEARDNALKKLNLIKGDLKQYRKDKVLLKIDIRNRRAILTEKERANYTVLGLKYIYGLKSYKNVLWVLKPPKRSKHKLILDKVDDLKRIFGDTLYKMPLNTDKIYQMCRLIKNSLPDIPDVFELLKTAKAVGRKGAERKKKCTSPSARSKLEQELEEAKKIIATLQKENIKLKKQLNLVEEEESNLSVTEEESDVCDEYTSEYESEDSDEEYILEEDYEE